MCAPHFAINDKAIHRGRHTDRERRRYTEIVNEEREGERDRERERERERRRERKREREYRRDRLASIQTEKQADK